MIVRLLFQLPIAKIKSSVSSQNICGRVVVWLLTNISRSNIFQKMLLLEKYIQNCQACFGLSECEWVKYTTFIHSLITTIQDSNVCCKIYRTPSTPVGYADNLAACRRLKANIDCLMQIVWNHGCVWRYNYNASKRGVLVYGESKRENRKNACNREFLLGVSKVKEGICRGLVVTMPDSQA